MKIEGAATTGCQGKLIYFISFLWPPVEAALLNFNVFFVKIFVEGINKNKCVRHPRGIESFLKCLFYKHPIAIS
jgi:hypothetical protein